MSNRLKEVRGLLHDRRTQLAAIFKEHPVKDGKFELPKEVAENVKSLNDETAELGAEEDLLKIADRNERALKTAAQPDDRLPWPGMVNEGPPARPLTIGELFVASEAYKSLQPSSLNARALFRTEDRASFADDSIKTLMTLSAGWAPANNRGNIVVPMAMRRPVVADLIPQDPTTNTQVRYLRETTFTNNAATVAEGAVKPESALALTEVQSNVQVVATTIKVSNQQLDDVPQVRGYIDNRLTTQIKLTEENQLISGDATGSNLRGLLNTSGILTGAAANQPDVPAAIFRQITAVRSTTGFSEPSGIVIHPNDWRDIRLMTTSTGEFLFGPPTEEGASRIWGLSIVPTTAISENTLVLGDFSFAHISRRQALVIEMGYVNDDFTRNQITIRAEERLSFEVLRPEAFSTVTNV